MTLDETLKYMESRLFEGWQDAWKKSTEILSKNGQKPTEDQVLQYTVDNFYGGKAPQEVAEKYANAKAKANSSQQLQNAQNTQKQAWINQMGAQAKYNNLLAQDANFYGTDNEELSADTKAAWSDSVQADKALDNANQNVQNIEAQRAEAFKAIQNLKTTSKPVEQNGLKEYYQNIANGEDLKNKIDNFDKLLSQTTTDFENLIDLVNKYCNDPEVAKLTAEFKATKEKNKSILGSKILNGAKKAAGGLVKGANILAGIAGSFIGNMAGGMGAAK